MSSSSCFLAISTALFIKLRNVAIILFAGEGIVTFATVFGSLIIFVAFLNTRRANDVIVALSSEIVAIMLTTLGVLIPRLDVRYCYSLYAFASAMTVHSRALASLERGYGQRVISSYDSDQNLLSRVASEENIKNKIASSSASNVSDCSIPLFKQKNQSLCNVFESLWFVRPKHAIFVTAPRVSVYRIMHFSIVAVLVDVCLYISREVIPIKISAPHRDAANALVIGVWLIFAMEFLYNIWIVSLGLLGSPAPLNTRHRHPLLSTSLTEFWGVRWNPIVCKLLQDSFYKPARRLGLPRAAAILACFAGSALLHAWPQYLATPAEEGLTYCAMMVSFFILHGAIVLTERLGLQITGIDKYFDKELLPRPASRHTGAKGQLVTEVLTCASLLSIAYVVLERPLWLLSRSELGVLVGLLVGAVTGFVSVHIQAEKTWAEGSSRDFLKVLSLKFVGWVWMLSCIIVTLPLFSLPVDSVLRSLYPHSFVVGNIVKKLVT